MFSGNRSGNNQPAPSEVVADPSRRGFVRGAVILGGAIAASALASACGSASAPNQAAKHPATATTPPRRPAKAPRLDISPDDPWVVDFTSMPDGPVPPELFGYDLGIGPNGDGWGNNEKQTYTDRRLNAEVSGGRLVVRAIHERYQGRDYTSARLTGRGRSDFVHGTLKFAVEFPGGGAGPWSALWMRPSIGQLGKFSPRQVGVAASDPNAWIRNGEIDAEYWGQWPNLLQGSVHTYDQVAHHPNGNQNTKPLNRAASQLHELGIVKSESVILLTRDGSPYVTYENPGNGDLREWPFEQPFYPIVNVAVGGDGNEHVDNQASPWTLSIAQISFSPRAVA